MELYRRLQDSDAFDCYGVKYIKIGNKEYKADDVLKTLKNLECKEREDKLNVRIADALVSAGVLFKSIGRKTCYIAVKKRFNDFYQEFMNSYWEDEEIFSTMEGEWDDDIDFDALDAYPCLTVIKGKGDKR
jgi:hypothetical protein